MSLPQRKLESVHYKRTRSIRNQKGSNYIQKVGLSGRDILITASVSNKIFSGKFGHKVMETHFRCHSFLAEPNHSATRHCCRRCVVETIDLQDYPHVVRDAQTLSTGESEHLVIVKNTNVEKKRVLGQASGIKLAETLVAHLPIQVLRPIRIHVSVENNPMPSF